MRFRRCCAVLPVLLALACSGSSDTGNTPCDPLATVPAATLALQTALGIGRHADGTIYVLDQTTANLSLRVFLSEAGVLQRKVIAGSGQGNDATVGAFYVVSVPDATAPFVLKVQGSGASLAMGVLRGPISSRDFVIGQQGDTLQVVGADAIAGLTVKDLPDTIYVEYLAVLPDGRQLVVSRPENDWMYSDFRLFLGTSDRMAGRRVKNVVRTLSGTTTIDFVMGGAEATAFFPWPLDGTAGAATLTSGGQTLTLATTAGTAPTGFMFLCL
jgi:hypothetical protein